MISDCRKDIVEGLCVECLHDIEEYRRKFQETVIDPSPPDIPYGGNYLAMYAYLDAKSRYLNALNRHKASESKIRDLLFTLKITASPTVQLSDTDVAILRRKYV